MQAEQQDEAGLRRLDPGVVHPAQRAVQRRRIVERQAEHEKVGGQEEGQGEAGQPVDQPGDPQGMPAMRPRTDSGMNPGARLCR